MEKLIQILTDMHPDVDFLTCDKLVDDKILDSFDIITLITDIDEYYGVVIPPEEIVPENFNSAQALFDLISRL